MFYVEFRAFIITKTIDRTVPAQYILYNSYLRIEVGNK